MVHTVSELTEKVGQTVGVRVDTWVIPMLVKDAKVSYGVARVLVSPVQGEGEAWVNSSRVVTQI